MSFQYLQDDEDEDLWGLSRESQTCVCISSIISRETVIQRIKDLVRAISERLTSDEQFEDCIISLNKRGSNENSQVDPLLGVRVLYDTPYKKEISLVKNPREFAIFLRVVAIVLRALEKEEMIAKRAIYYQDPILFEHQRNVDQAIEDLACYLEVPRASLYVLACPKGLVAGCCKWTDRKTNRMTDCSTSIQNIPHLIDSIDIPEGTDPVAIFVVEKEAVFMRLVQSTIVTETIIITGKGVPDYATRLFLKLLSDRYYNIPIVGLFDMDPWGFAIMMTYKFGSRRAAYDGMNMACPQLQWLGIRPSDLGLINKRNLLELTDTDRRRLNSILQETSLPEEYRKELLIMKQKNVKAEIEALMTESMELTDIYLPDKFAHRDWI